MLSGFVAFAFRFQVDFAIRVENFRSEGLRLMVSKLGFMVQGLVRVWGLGREFRSQGLRVRPPGLR